MLKYNMPPKGEFGRVMKTSNTTRGSVFETIQHLNNEPFGYEDPASTFESKTREAHVARGEEIVKGLKDKVATTFYEVVGRSASLVDTVKEKATALFNGGKDRIKQASEQAAERKEVRRVARQETKLARQEAKQQKIADEHAALQRRKQGRADRAQRRQELTKQMQDAKEANRHDKTVERQAKRQVAQAEAVAAQLQMEIDEAMQILAERQKAYDEAGAKVAAAEQAVAAASSESDKRQAELRLDMAKGQSLIRGAELGEAKLKTESLQERRNVAVAKAEKAMKARDDAIERIEEFAAGARDRKEARRNMRRQGRTDTLTRIADEDPNLGWRTGASVALATTATARKIVEGMLTMGQRAKEAWKVNSAKAAEEEKGMSDAHLNYIP